MREDVRTKLDGPHKVDFLNCLGRRRPVVQNRALRPFQVLVFLSKVIGATQAKIDAEEAAKRLARPDEKYTVDLFDEGCPKCRTVAR